VIIERKRVHGDGESVAPVWLHQSGKLKGARYIWGRPRAVGRVPYVAALIAALFNPALDLFHDRLAPQKKAEDHRCGDAEDRHNTQRVHYSQNLHGGKSRE
jgi:hypothetical protein